MPIIQKSLNQLARIKQHKGMYFLPQAEHAEIFLTGFRTALISTGVPITHQSGSLTLEKRGWRLTAIGVIPSMRLKGLTDEQMINELLNAFMEELSPIPDIVYDTDN